MFHLCSVYVQRTIYTRETHIMKLYLSLSGRAKPRPFKSSEVKSTLILTKKQILLFNLPSLALCRFAQSDTLTPTFLEKQSWLISLDIRHGSSYCCFHIDHSRNPNPGLRWSSLVGVKRRSEAKPVVACRGQGLGLIINTHLNSCTR